MYFQVKPDCSKDISISEKRRTAHAEKNYSQESLQNEIILEFRRSLGDNHNIHEFFQEEFSLYNDFQELKFCYISTFFFYSLDYGNHLDGPNWTTSFFIVIRYIIFSILADDPNGPLPLVNTRLYEWSKWTTFHCQDHFNRFYFSQSSLVFADGPNGPLVDTRFQSP